MSFAMSCALSPGTIGKARSSPCPPRLAGSTAAAKYSLPCERAREEIRRRGAKARAALDIIVKQFALDASSPILQAALHFVEEWEKKKVNRTTELEELVDYLGLFREAGGVIPMLSQDDARDRENAVRLMTAHGVKGLEFPHVVILRANPPCVPRFVQRDAGGFPSGAARSGFDHRGRRQDASWRGRAPPVLRCHDAGSRFAAHLCERGHRQNQQDSRRLHAGIDREQEPRLAG